MRIRTYVVATLSIVVFSSLLWGWYARSPDEVSYETVPVVRGEVARTVEVTGYVEPLARVSLAFPVGGRIASMTVAEGDTVLRGETLATLATLDQEALVREAEARLGLEEARYTEIALPVREETRVAETVAVAQAERAREKAKESAHVALSRAYTHADDAVRKKADILFSRSAQPSFGTQFMYQNSTYVINTTNTLRAEINILRLEASEALARMQNRATSTAYDVLQALDETQRDLLIIESLFSKLADAVNAYRPGNIEEQTVYETYRTSISQGRTTLANTRSDVASVASAYSVTETTYARALADKTARLAGPQAETLRTQEAAVQVARRLLGTARTRIQDSVLTAPIPGVISRVRSKEGEVVAPSEPVIEMLTPGAYEVEAYIPEADIAEIRLGQSARVTFDAFSSSELFSAEVVRIALSETVREGVPTYKTTFAITELPREDMVLRPGMTADCEVAIDMRTDTLFVPTRSIQREGNRTFVRVITAGAVVERTIIEGLRGSGGTTEVTEGVMEGDEVVVYMREK